MIRRWLHLAAPLFVVCALFLPRAGLADWGFWHSVSGAMLESPTCVSWGTNRIDCFARGPDRSLYHWWWSASDGDVRAGWHGPQTLGATLLDRPSCITRGVDRINCFARLADGTPGHIAWYGGGSGGIEGWTYWSRLSGTVLDSPSCASWGPNRIDCFARGGDRAMYHWAWDGRAWTAHERLGGVLVDRPDCFSEASERLTCVARGTDALAYSYRWDGARWNGWTPIGQSGRLLQPPSCAVDSRGLLVCAGLSLARNLMLVRQRAGGDFPAWVSDLQQLVYRVAPVCTVGGTIARHISCFVVDDRGHMLQFLDSPGPEVLVLHQDYKGELTSEPSCRPVETAWLPPGYTDRRFQRDTYCFANGAASGLRWEKAISDPP